MYEKRYCYLKYYVCRHASFSGVVILPRCLLPRERLDPPLDLTLFIGRASSKWTQTRYRQLMNWVLFGEDLSEAPYLDCGCFAYINWILVWVKSYAVNTADSIWFQKHQVLSIITVIEPHLQTTSESQNAYSVTKSRKKTTITAPGRTSTYSRKRHPGILKCHPGFDSQRWTPTQP